MTFVLLVDDKSLLRAGIRTLLETSVPKVEVAEAESGEQALMLLGKREFDLVFLDISMPGMNGLDSLRQIRARWPTLPVVMLSVHEDRQYVVSAMEAGANGYVAKDAKATELLSAFSNALAGKEYYCRIAQGARNSPDAKIPALEKLSPRELEVFIMFSGGAQPADVAKALSIERRTVTSHKRNIFTKLGLSTNYDMYSLMVDIGLLGAPDPPLNT